MPTGAIPGQKALPRLERLEQLRAFLKACRHRIPPEARVLGPRARLSLRCGRPVTQEELAEAIGVSRAWYAMLESGATIRVSAQLLDRLAGALMLTPKERATLFCLAIPELERAQEFFAGADRALP